MDVVPDDSVTVFELAFWPFAAPTQDEWAKLVRRFGSEARMKWRNDPRWGLHHTLSDADIEKLFCMDE